MNGVIVVNKPRDFTSFDVVAVLRGILKMKKIGHSGTLDPKATGVLPVFIGDATKLCDYLPEDQKTYEAEMTLGIGTDTEDIWGEVREEKEVRVSPEEVERAVLSFKGEYDQIPPMYSAKKIAGKKLYEYARQGIDIKREPVRVEIFDICITKMDLPRVCFTVTCSKGTYIRTLCCDIGKVLGLPACMSALNRTVHGRFTIENAKTPEEIERYRDEGRLQEILIPVSDLFDYPCVTVTGDGEQRLKNGNKLLKEQLQGELSEYIRVKDTEGRFKAIYRYKKDEDLYIPEKMFLNL